MSNVVLEVPIQKRSERGSPPQRNEARHRSLQTRWSVSGSYGPVCSTAPDVHVAA